MGARSHFDVDAVKNKSEQLNGNGQNGTALLGKILRIDVAALPYSIPTDNPFILDGDSGHRRASARCRHAVRAAGMDRGPVNRGSWPALDRRWKAHRY